MSLSVDSCITGKKRETMPSRLFSLNRCLEETTAKRNVQETDGRSIQVSVVVCCLGVYGDKILDCNVTLLFLSFLAVLCNIPSFPQKNDAGQFKD